MDLESLFSHSPNKAADKSVDLKFEIINFDRPKEVTIDPFLMDFQVHAQSDKSIISFFSSLQALFSCITCLSNKQDCSYSSQYLIYDQSLCITSPVLDFYYLLIWQVNISFLIFLVAHCTASTNKEMYVYVKRHIEILPQTWKFPFLIYIISTSVVPNLAPLMSFVGL